MEIEKRIPVRTVLKRTLFRAAQNKEVLGTKIRIAGRLNGSEIHRSETLSQGRNPMTTIRANIDYAEERALCTYGHVGVKIWLYKGDIL